MIHQIQIADGVATYSNFYIRTPRFEAMEKLGREGSTAFSDMVMGGAAAIEKAKLVERKRKEGLLPSFDPLEASTASTAVQVHKGVIYCLSELTHPFALNARREGNQLLLDGSGKSEDWGGALKSPFSAHPRIDPKDGTFFNLSLERTTNSIFYSRLVNGEILDHQMIYDQSQMKAPMAFLHDYIVTDHYIIFPDTSIRIMRERLVKHGGIFHFDDSYNLRWGVLPRVPKPGDQVRWFETKSPGFIWHMINGWEVQDARGAQQVVLYAPVFKEYPDTMPIHSPLEPHSTVQKWVLDLRSGAVSEEVVLLEGAYERPSINLAYSGKPGRYTYLLDESSGYMGKGVQKYDLLNEEARQYLDYESYLGGEPLFVPRSGGTDEDDGYLVDLLMKPDSADLVVFCAKEMKEIARIKLPQRVPFGVHACWIDEETVSGLRVTDAVSVRA